MRPGDPGLRRAAPAARRADARPHGGVPGPAVTEACAVGVPLLEVHEVSRLFPVRGTRRWLHAVDGVSLSVMPGECVGLVGESGCGKSTLVRLIARLLDPTGGRIVFDGRDIGTVPAWRFARAAERAWIQMVFQDPVDSLNPRFTAFDTIADPLRRLGVAPERPRLRDRVWEAADLVGLSRELLGRFPHQLSGGQQQRVAIARAIAVRPRLLLLDEPTSALDVSVQVVILHLLADLQQKLGMTYLFVSHDLNLVRLLSNRVLVMYCGRIVEAGPAEAVFNRPDHPYTRALLSAVPVVDPGERRPRIRLAGEPRSPVEPPATVCRFYGRCPEGFERCEREMPALRPIDRDHQVACHLFESRPGTTLGE
ncbi:MAG: ABC transporter ATP-binding protein [Candidatus Rokubacteria bacterium]|nr:ABC transporter ATP-binding protein [Candidatus Rokubacteria bacterium]